MDLPSTNSASQMSSHRSPASEITEGEASMTSLLRGIKAPSHPAGVYPEPLIYQPTSTHKQTFIILHGRGSFASRFSTALLATSSSLSSQQTTPQTLQTVFPNAKLILPTAPRTPATIYGNKLTHQWFNNWHLEQHTQRQELMTEGLKRSCEYVHEILKREIEVVGSENVVLWGLSQGCAVSLAALLTWEGERLGAVVGMCGWLPYGNLVEAVGGYGVRDGSDPISRLDRNVKNSDDGEDDCRLTNEKGLSMEAVTSFREKLQMGDNAGSAFKNIPVFLGHGTADERVSIALGREAKECLDILGVETQFVEYEGLGHWYSPEMLRDILNFLNEKLA